MASLKNVRHEKFAQCVASGLSGADAYRQAAEYSGKQADGNAANWMKRPGVRERIEELKAESSARCTLSREAYIRSLVEMYEAKPWTPRWTIRGATLSRGARSRRCFRRNCRSGRNWPSWSAGTVPTKVELEAGTESGQLSLARLFVGGGTLGGSNQSAGRMATMANASSKQAVPQAASGIDEEAGARGFPRPRLAA